MELEPASDSRLRRLTLSYRWRIQFYVIDPSLSPRYGCGQAVLRGWIQLISPQGKIYWPSPVMPPFMFNYDFPQNRPVHRTENVYADSVPFPT